MRTARFFLAWVFFCTWTCVSVWAIAKAIDGPTEIYPRHLDSYVDEVYNGAFRQGYVTGYRDAKAASLDHP